mgnify:CR=1 FL=1
MSRRVILHPEAVRDLSELYLYIAGEGRPLAAKSYIDRVVAYCENLSTFPQRGASRPDLGPGARVVGFERRVSIIFAIRGDDVVIGGIAYAGRLVKPFPED